MSSKVVADFERRAQLASLSEPELQAILARAKWKRMSRAEQFRPSFAPDDKLWSLWLLNCGRGWGKTRTMVEWGWWECWKSPNSILNAVARTSNDLKTVLFEGQSGFFNVIPQSIIAHVTRSPYTVTLINGSMIQGFSAEKPAALRGPQCHFALADEIAHWMYPDEALSNLFFGLRLVTENGRPSARAILGTTPLPLPHVKEFIKRAKDPTDSVALSLGSTYDNRSNLAPAFFTEVIRKFEGTRLGRQELMGELLEDTPGALWTWKLIEASRGPVRPASRIVVGVDPPGATAECGIVVVQRDQGNTPATGCVLADYSTAGTPDFWARKVVMAVDEHHADAVIVEINQGGKMVANVLRTAAQAMHAEGARRTSELRIIEVHASRGKASRAEPISALYEQGRIRHVHAFSDLESQMTDWSPLLSTTSPDRMDALVWALTEAIIHSKVLAPGSLPTGFGARFSPIKAV